MTHRLCSFCGTVLWLEAPEKTFFAAAHPELGGSKSFPEFEIARYMGMPEDLFTLCTDCKNSDLALASTIQEMNK